MVAFVNNQTKPRSRTLKRVSPLWTHLWFSVAWFRMGWTCAESLWRVPVAVASGLPGGLRPTCFCHALLRRQGCSDLWQRCCNFTSAGI